MPTFIVRHNVEDFDTWLGFHNEREALFPKGTVTAFRTFRDADDPSMAVLLIDVEDPDRFAAFVADPETQAAREKHGVLDPVFVSIEVAT